MIPISVISPPADWTWHPLGRVMWRSRRAGAAEWEPLSVFLDAGVVRRADREDNHNQLGAELSNYLVVEPGDLVFNKLRIWQGGFGHSRYRGIVSPAYYVLRPNPGVDPRFVDYLLHSAGYLAELTRLSKFMPPSQFDMPWEDLKGLPVPLPPLDVQRRIADFLDDQVAKLDRFVDLRRRQQSLVTELLSSTLEGFLSGFPENLRLDQLTDPKRPIQYGIVLPGPHHPGGVPIVKGGDVAAHRMNPSELSCTDPGIEAAYPRSRLMQGDILMAIRGSVGELAVVPADLAGANITQDAARIAPRGCDWQWLRWALQTPTVQQRVAREITGATVKGINIVALRRVLIPIPPVGRQAELGRRAARIAEESTRLADRCRRSEQLIRERKRALITAAVTGEFDVTTASSRAADAALSGVGGVG